MENTQIKNTDSAKIRKYWRILCICLLAAIIVGTLFFLFSPIRTRSAENYVKSGDNLLADKKYVSAGVQYEKALALDPDNTTAKERKMLTEAAAKDVTELKGFYSNDQKFESQFAELNNALAVPATENDALRLSKKFVDKKEFQLAILPAKTATEMDSGYAVAWQYLAIVYKDAANFSELTPQIKDQYLSNSDLALQKARLIDPTFSIK